MRKITVSLVVLTMLYSTSCKEPKAESVTTSTAATESASFVVDLSAAQKKEFEVEIPETGRYVVTFYGNKSGTEVWLEDYIENMDGRTYNITGTVVIDGLQGNSIDGSPLKAGKHPMRVNVAEISEIDSIGFSLMLAQRTTPEIKSQTMEGEEWELVWSDEFDGEGLPDTSKWSYNVGNWGWGNNELQYYTAGREENARLSNGNLIIEARKNDDGKPWTSARLTTQGKVAFQYGKIEFRAKVPVGRGTWAAGWMLGDEYKDELSWPYCGEIDILECVGYEIDDATGKGINHATCHTRAYYFKQNNQIGSEIEMDSMNSVYHTYGVEWYPNVIYGYVDGKRYYTYDKTADELEWPFHKAQNIILNLAVGGGWGGAKGVDESYSNHQFIIDYVRVYQKK